MRRVASARSSASCASSAARSVEMNSDRKRSGSDADLTSIPQSIATSRRQFHFDEITKACDLTGYCRSERCPKRQLRPREASCLGRLERLSRLIFRPRDQDCTTSIVRYAPGPSASVKASNCHRPYALPTNNSWNSTRGVHLGSHRPYAGVLFAFPARLTCRCRICPGCLTIGMSRLFRRNGRARPALLPRRRSSWRERPSHVWGRRAGQKRRQRAHRSDAVALSKHVACRMLRGHVRSPMEEGSPPLEKTLIKREPLV